MGDKDDQDKPGNRPRHTRRPDSGEAKLWRTVTTSITPIERNSPDMVPPGKADEAPETPKKPPRKRKTPVRTTPPAAAETPRRQKLAPESGIDKRTLDRLRRGKTPIEAVIDLHGLRRHEAHQRLQTFILSCWKSGKRALLVITGKGTRSPEPGGVLRKEVPLWLHDAPLGDKILTIQTAQPKDGGSGAFYVLLRRRRED